MTPQQFDALLTLGVRKGVSDVHLEVGYPPMYRVNGGLFGARMEALKPEDTASAVSIVLGGRGMDGMEADRSYSIAGLSRFRVSIFRQRNSFGMVLRIIPFEIPALASLQLPAAIERITQAREGLVLVTGATGQGKSTTIASLLAKMNQTERVHLVTIEDPIEFLFPVAQALVIQREVGADTESFKDALRAAMRQDPDVIMVGEMRDPETADTCIKAAETGHLVIATLHTMDVQRSIGRFVGLFPAEEQNLVRGRLADVLRAVVSLRQIPRADGQGLVPACELMFSTTSIQQAIRDPERTQELPELIARSKGDLGSQTFDQHILELVHAGKITKDTARANASSAGNVERDLAFEGDGGAVKR